MTPRTTIPPRHYAEILGTAKRYGASIGDVLAPTRVSKSASEARDAAFAAVRAVPTISGKTPSYPLIGRWFGRHHTAVMDGERRHAARRSKHLESA